MSAMLQRQILQKLFALMSPRELSHLIDRSMHSLSECHLTLNAPAMTLHADQQDDYNREFDFFYFVVTEGLRYRKGNRLKFWKASTPHIQAHARNRQLAQNQRNDRTRASRQEVQAARHRRIEDARYRRELQARREASRAAQLRQAALRPNTYTLGDAIAQIHTSRSSS